MTLNLAPLLPVLTFLGTLIAAVAAWLALAPRAAPQAAPEGEASLDAQAPPTAAERRVSEVVSSLAGPAEPDERDALRNQLIQAGWRGRTDLAFYLGARAALAFAGPVLGFLVLHPNSRLGLASTLLVGAAVGYYLPWTALHLSLSNRRKALLQAFPNALDMLVSCLEAGLGLDSAVQRVSRELAPTAPELALELSIVGQETLAGLSRTDALRRLADRTGLAEVSSLVNVLAHAEKYGSGVAATIRTHAQLVRRRRALEAEQRAARAAPKLTVIMVLFILPSLFVVVLGPTVVNILAHLVPVLQSGGGQ